ncbi:YebC/PmpR family DNA-binding transcriptional regulator [Pyxidicoccus xibeiensis]|uniref:YebC/PmpR family DNA-binding transcriptional regulator n=1 Tax=Pyxidicoccus xibeiensis TaxID=2906759 RepID=UPI0020A80E9A|nr:YebC/PmpR family DNA-binding transcriptional regulator [Pyxidicoccus xibeiensis]MCP3143784.1 YebC/PmpR family DNA-binding transcriptional regulator [Pyxidicoccus xibeiensis]
MSGHNRWSKIKRQKAAMGATKGKLYSKVIKEITVASRLGGGDPAGNARLRVALALAREANIPKDTIERAIKKGTGELEGEAYEEVTYEGYGPGGVAMLVECLTDNRNRTAADVRSTFGAYGGNLGAEGAVAWMFQKKGAITVKPGPTEDQVMEQAIEAGAEDVINLGDEGFEVRTAPADLHTVATRLETAGLKLGEQKWTHLPQNTVRVEGDTAPRLLKLMDALDENDDVQNVHANFEMDESVMESLSR